MDHPGVHLQNVTKRYPGGVLAVRGVEIRVAEGELTVLLGPSGCGKTTILRLIAGLEAPTSGTISIAGRPVNRLPPRDRDVALVPQVPALYPHLSVRENMAFGLRRRGCPREETERRVAGMARKLSVERLLDRRPGTLSGGERQRVALGRALVRRPQALLLDEPLTSLDAPLRWQLRHEIRRLWEELRPTTIHVTHDQDEAMALAGRLVVLRDGAIEQEGSAAGVYAAPANRFVAGFVGSPPMSFLRGHARPPREGAPAEFRTAGGSLRLPPRLAEKVREERALVLGVRAGSVRARESRAEPAEAAGGSALVARVLWSTPRPGGLLLACSIGDGEEVLAEADGGHVAAGDEVVLALEMSGVYLFDPEKEGQNVAMEERPRPLHS